VYNWGSGFSDICHHIYGQPIDHIYLKLWSFVFFWYHLI
jgi:hypothetical protein